MFVHWSKHINIEELGRRIVSVECSNCGCEYYYTLIRIGTGSATAHYSIGVEKATRAARKQAREDLNRRLESEAELVPCPKCFWVNDELIQGYRLGRYRSAGTYAAVFAFFGACIPLVYAWHYYTDPAAARTTLTYYLLGGTALFWLIALAIVGVRRFLRSLIQPNRYFPEPPRLPPGVPTAHLLDAGSGELVPVNSQVPEDAANRRWIDFRIGNDYIPMVCCDCLQEATDGQGHTSQLTSTMHLIIPRCQLCAQLARGMYWRTWFVFTASSLVLIGAAAAWMKLNSPELWIVAGGVLAILMGLAFYLAARAIRPVKVKICDKARGIAALRFRNREYASVVAKHLSTL